MGKAVFDEPFLGGRFKDLRFLKCLRLIREMIPFALRIYFRMGGKKPPASLHSTTKNGGHHSEDLVHGNV